MRERLAETRDQAAAAESIALHRVGGPGRALAEPPTVAQDETGAAEADDPNKGAFGGSPRRNGRVLHATLSPVAGEEGWARIRLEVRSEDPARPLAGKVTFHLHPTFPSRTPTVRVVDGTAVLYLVAWGAFTVGAVADDGETRLELDLATVDGAPGVFYTR